MRIVNHNGIWRGEKSFAPPKEENPKNKSQRGHMREERLLERLSTGYIRAKNLSPLQTRESGTREDLLVASVTNHINAILNTRKGTVQIDPEYGLPDFTHLPGNFASFETEAIAKTISSLIKRYEPRIKDVSVSFRGSAKDSLSLLFVLAGTIVHREKRIPLRFLTQLMPDREIRVSIEDEAGDH